MIAADPDDVRAADYGPRVNPGGALARTKKAMLASVLYPDTAREWSWKGPRKGWVKQGVFGGVTYGWIMECSVWSRNIFGGDSRHRMYCMFRDHSLVAKWHGHEGNIVWGDAPGQDR